MTDSALLKLIPIDDIARQLGVPEKVAKDAIEQAIPAIVGGMAANAKDAGGAKSLEKALSQHAAAPAARTSVNDIDTADGEKIVSNVFGARKTEVAAAVAEKSPAADVTKDLIAKVLPIIAPIVIAYIAKKFLGDKDEKGSTTTSTTAPSGGLGDILGGLLGGSGGGSGGGDVLGGLLGGLLGGGKK